MLLNFQPFVFYPNNGNLGDGLIAASTYSLFRRLRLNFTIYHGKLPDHDFNFVYSGGGVFIEGVWGCGNHIRNIIKSPRLKRGLILSHSIIGCSDLISMFEEKFTILCREPVTYEAALRMEHKPKLILANDMALYSGLEWYNEAIPNTNNNGELTTTQRSTYEKYVSAYNKLLDVIKYKTYKKGDKTVRFFFRNDKEKAKTHSLSRKIDRIDLSTAALINFEIPADVMTLTYLFMAMLDSTDIVITDRLHVGIGAFKTGNHALVFDNSYGKISGIISTSLATFDNIKFIPEETGINLDEYIKVNVSEIPKAFEKANLTDPRRFKSIYEYYENLK
jgi:exopolysaccharide biosynthesis predicted pyruvyltransferase EpsI